ncbi:MAG: iron ABC transporter permease [bacterium]|nr:iron ABC transporter permease [bacterium]
MLKQHHILAQDLFHQLKQRQRTLILLGLILALAGMLVAIASVNLGQAEIGAAATVKILLGKMAFQPTLLQDLPASQVAIVWNIRLPRILVALLVGSGLAVSGAVFQSLLMNPLADSYTIGVSSGAALGAVLAIYMNMFLATTLVPVSLFAFLGALLTLFVVIKIASRNGYVSAANLIIAGIIVSSIFSAGISLLKSLSGEQVATIVAWLMGSLAARTWPQVLLALPFVLGGTLVCSYFAGELNLLSLGEQESRALGVNVQTVRRIYTITASLLTAVCVSVSGIIGFVGLIVPHLLRFAVSSDNRALIPLSALLGGVLLLLADNVSRLLFALEIPVGVITTLFGGPFFIYVFVKRNTTLQ